MIPRRSLLVVALLLLVAPGVARAQPIFGHAESIDSMVADADGVYIGVLAGADGAEATLVVEETLKGEHHGRLRVRFPANRHFDPAGPADRVLVTVAGAPPEVSRRLLLSGDGGEVLGADFTLHRGPIEVARAARDAARARPRVTRMASFGVPVPARAVVGTRWAHLGGNLFLAVPVDDRLERWALDALGSGDRRQALIALRSFKSDANIARVKALLDDPESSILSPPRDNIGLQVRGYFVRRKAFETLKYWGVPAAEPITEERADRPDLVTMVVYGNSWVTDAQLDELARFPNLEHLDLVNEPITDERLRRIGGLKTLRTLDLGGTQVSDAGLAALAAMAGLRHLDLGADHVTGEGLAALAGLKELATVDLRQSWAGDAAIRPLAALSGLKKVVLSETRVSDAGIAELRRLRPDVEIKR